MAKAIFSGTKFQNSFEKVFGGGFIKILQLNTSRNLKLVLEKNALRFCRILFDKVWVIFVDAQSKYSYVTTLNKSQSASQVQRFLRVIWRLDLTAFLGQYSPQVCIEIIVTK